MFFFAKNILADTSIYLGVFSNERRIEKRVTDGETKGGKYKMKRKSIAFLLMLSLFCGFLFLFPITAQAVRGVGIYVNGEKVQTDTATYVNGTGHTMVPLRFVAEALGYFCHWDARQNQCQIQKDDFTLQMRPNSKLAKTEEKSAVMPAACELKNDRIMIPLRFVAETLGCSVTWLEQYNRILIEWNGQKPQLTSELDLSGKTIVLDPGHGYWNPQGLYDPGAVGPTGLQEQKVNLAIAKRAAVLLQESGATVIVTRENAEDGMSLAARAAQANTADIFVSIHCNANDNSAYQGTATYCHSDSVRLKADLELASYIQDGVVASLGRKDLGEIKGWFNVLRHCKVPACLLEVAFISNPTEEKLMKETTFIENAAVGLTNGIGAYFAR